MKKYAKLLMIPAAFLALGSYSATAVDYEITDDFETIVVDELTNGNTYYFPVADFKDHNAEVADKLTATKNKTNSISDEDGYVKCTAISSTKCKVTAVVLGDTEGRVTFEDKDDYKVPYTLNVGSNKTVVIPEVTITLGTLVAGDNTTITVDGTLKGGIKTSGEEVEVNGKVTGTITYTVAAPKLVKAVLGAEDDSVIVKIAGVENADKYEIYRATSKTGSYTLVKSVAKDDLDATTVREGKAAVKCSAADIEAATTGDPCKGGNADVTIKTPAVTAIEGYSYEDETVKAGNTYYYKVKAVRKSSKSDYSEAMEKEDAVTVPVAKAEIKTVKSDSYNSIKLTVKKVDGATGYEFYKKTDGDADFSKLGYQTSTTYTAKNLKTDVEYTFKVRAYATVDGKKVYGAYSEVSAAVKPELAKTKLSATATTTTSNASIKFTFTKVTGANGYCVVKKDADPTGLDKDDDNCTTGTTLTLKTAEIEAVLGVATGEANGVKAEYEAYAFRTVDGASKFSKEASNVVKVGLKPITPTIKTSGITTKASDTQEVKVTFKEAIANDDEVLLYKSTSKTGTFKLVEADVVVAGDKLSATFTVDELTAGKTYYYKARIKTATDVYSEYSAAAGKELTVADFTKNTEAHKYITATVNGAHSNKVVLHLDEADFGIAGGVDGFAISRKITSSGTYKVVKTFTVDSDDVAYDELEYVHKGLTTGKTYYYKVRAFKTVDGKKVYGKFSTVVKSTPKAPAPETIYAEATDKQVELSWEKTKNVTGYKIYRDDVLIATTSKLSYVDKKVEEDEEYTYVVKAYVKVKGTNKIGYASKELTIKTLEGGDSNSVDTTLEWSLTQEEDED